MAAECQQTPKEEIFPELLIVHNKYQAKPATNIQVSIIMLVQTRKHTDHRTKGQQTLAYSCRNISNEEFENIETRCQLYPQN